MYNTIHLYIPLTPTMHIYIFYSYIYHSHITYIIASHHLSHIYRIYTVCTIKLYIYHAHVVQYMLKYRVNYIPDHTIILLILLITRGTNQLIETKRVRIMTFDKLLLKSQKIDRFCCCNLKSDIFIN